MVINACDMCLLSKLMLGLAAVGPVRAHHVAGEAGRLDQVAVFDKARKHPTTCPSRDGRFSP